MNKKLLISVFLALMAPGITPIMHSSSAQQYQPLAYAFVELFKQALIARVSYPYILPTYLIFFGFYVLELVIYTGIILAILFFAKKIYNRTPDFWKSKN